LESKTPVAITRHGDTVGFYLPVRRKRTEAEKAAFREAGARLQAMLDAAGVTEDDIIADFQQWRKEQRAKRR